MVCTVTAVSALEHKRFCECERAVVCIEQVGVHSCFASLADAPYSILQDSACCSKLRSCESRFSSSKGGLRCTIFGNLVAYKIKQNAQFSWKKDLKDVGIVFSLHTRNELAALSITSGYCFPGTWHAFKTDWLLTRERQRARFAEIQGSASLLVSEKSQFSRDRKILNYANKENNKILCQSGNQTHVVSVASRLNA